MKIYLDTNILFFLIQERDEISTDVLSELTDYSNSL